MTQWEHGRWTILAATKSKIMEDDEYSAYLKTQTYDELISISLSLNQESQSKRYKMVLAELDERDKRGEKPRVAQDGSRNFGGIKILYLLFALAFAGMAAVSLYTGHAPLRHGGSVSMTDRPAAFWSIVGIQVFFAILLFYRAFKGRKDKK